MTTLDLKERFYICIWNKNLKDRIEKFSDCISTLKTTVNRRNFIETLDELSTAIYFKNEEGENNDRKNR